VSDLAPDSIETVILTSDVDPASMEFLPHLAPGLHRLYVGSARLSDVVLPHIAQLKELRYLQTWGNCFTDAGVQELVALRALVQLYLEEDGLSTAACGFARQLPNLKRLGIMDVPITEHELAELRLALPGVNVG
jgi:hypothetical protein